MRRRSGRVVSGLAVAILGLGGGSWCAAQAVNPQSGSFASGMAPQFPPSGDWVEVVTVTPKWLVLQNQSGQQFPVSFDAVQQFVIRWPIAPERITAGALVETMGVDLGSNRIQTDHVDVFEGSARSMTRPTLQRVIGYNRRPTQFDVINQNIYGVYVPLLPGENQIPDRLHVAGPIAGYNPLSVAIAGNNAVSILPSGGGLFFSQVTAGSASLLRQGDLVYVVPSDMTPRSLILSQMVAYKTIPLSQFVP